MTVGESVIMPHSDKWTLCDLAGLRGIVRHVSGGWVQIEWTGADHRVTWLPIADLTEG